MKLLCIGFSVTEMETSYYPLAENMVLQQGLPIQMEKCGIGGISIIDLSYFIESIISSNPHVTHVIFDISTGNGRADYLNQIAFNPNYMKIVQGHIETLIMTCKCRGIEVGFILFPRKDVDPFEDMVDSVIISTCLEGGLPFVSVGRELRTYKIDIDTILSDEVHPTPAGAELYAIRLVSLIKDLILLNERKSVSHHFLGIPALVKKTVSKFSRHGFSANFVKITGNEQITINLPIPYEVTGVAVISGPKGGLLTIQSAGFHQKLFYDQWCYYDRIMTMHCPIGRTDRVSLHLGNEIPNVNLLKGEKYLGSRQMGLIGFFVDGRSEILG